MGLFGLYAVLTAYHLIRTFRVLRQSAYAPYRVGAWSSCRTHFSNDIDIQADADAHITSKILSAQLRAGNMIAGIQQQTMSIIICARCFPLLLLLQ